VSDLDALVDGPRGRADAPEELSRRAPELRGPVLMSQSWCDVAFLHWFVPPEQVRPFMPPGTEPDVVESGRWAGSTPVALVPFQMVGAGLGRGPAVGYLGTFWETNVRLYSVDRTGRRGVVFRSLDASRLAVVLAARSAFNLPYRWARMGGGRRHRDGARELIWTTRTRWPGKARLLSRIVLRVGEPLPDGAADAPLATFVTARWGLHTAHLGRTWYVPNEHEPWPLRRAEVLHLDDRLLAAAGLPGLADRPPDHVLFADRVSTRFGPPGAAARPRAGR
jgi:uncharacterized protein